MYYPYHYSSIAFIERQLCPNHFVIVNLTPRDVNLYSPDGTLRTIYPRSGTVATVDVSETYVGEIDGIPLVQQLFGKIQGLPDPIPGTFYLVPPPTLSAAKEQGRTDVIALDTGPDSVVRDEKGTILGGRRFVY